MSESMLRVQPKTKPVIYLFWRGVSRPSGNTSYGLNKPLCPKLRWDKTDLQSYYLYTGATSSIYIFLYKILSYRREIALQGGLVITQNGRLELGDNILYWHYRSIFKFCDVIGRQSNRIQWQKRKIRAITPLKVIQGHRFQYATSY